MAAAAPKRPSLWPGAFKLAFQKIHSPTTSRASGWARGCRLPRPPACRGEPLARAPPGSALTFAGSPPCWEGRADRGAASLRLRLSRARFRCARHFRAWAALCAARFRRARLRGRLSSVSLFPGLRCLLTVRPQRRRKGAFPALAVELQRPGRAAKGHVAPVRRPQPARGFPRAQPGSPALFAVPGPSGGPRFPPGQAWPPRA